MERAKQATEILLPIRFRDCDLLGHVNNSVYLTYFEEARINFIRHAFGESGLEGINFIIARVEIDYKYPASLGQTLRVEISVGRVGRSSFEFIYKITDSESGIEIASGKSVQVSYDYAEGHSVPLPDSLKEKLKLYADSESDDSQ